MIKLKNENSLIFQIKSKMPSKEKIHYNEEFHKQRKLDTAEIPKLKTLSTISRTEITKARTALGKTQVEMNQLCQFPLNTLRDIESGKIQPSSVQLRTLNSRLGITVKME